VFSSQFSVHLTKGLDLVVNNGLLLGVQVDFGDFVTIYLGTDTLPDNLGGVDKVLEEVLVNSGESSGTRSLLGNSGSPGGDGENSAEGEENDVSVGKLLFEFTGKANRRRDVSDLVARIPNSYVSQLWLIFMSPGGAHTVVEPYEIAGEAALGRR